MDSSITLNIASRQVNVRLAGAAVGAVCRAVGFDGQDAGLLQLAVEEALTNIIRHAYGGDPDRRVELVATVDADSLILDLSHDGVPLDHWPEPADQPPAASQEGGRGVYLINAIMDTVRQDTRGAFSLISMAKGLPRP